MTDLRPATAANDDRWIDAAARITAAARLMVRSEDLEEALSLAASAIGEALVGEAVIRVTATQHDLLAGASGVVPPSALPPAVREVLSGPVDLDGATVDPADAGTRGVLMESSGIHATCRVWAGVGRTPSPGVAERTVAELLLHSLAQAVDRRRPSTCSGARPRTTTSSCARSPSASSRPAPSRTRSSVGPRLGA